MTIKDLARRLVGPAVLACLAHEACAQTPVVKVDLDMVNRPESEVNEPGYVPWPVVSANTVSQTFGDVTVTFTRQGVEGSSLKSHWFKAGFDAPAYARLVSDGITVDGGEAGAAILMTIANLPAGEHTLLVYLNRLDNPETQTFAPVDISVDGALVVDALAPSTRALATRDAQAAYLTFNSNGGEVEVLFEADASAGASNNNVVINAFELNTPNAANQATAPVPGDGDWHVNADSGQLTLRWDAAPDAVAHEVYFGTDEDNVRNGASEAFQGNQTDTHFEVDELYSRQQYYWRVDQVGADGTLTKGNVWSFRPRQLAFPEAEGYGRFAIGGRGGQVVKVTNLNDSGPGSLREAVTQHEGPRTIIFDVSGIITLEERLTLSDSFVTVAGQTAPGKGIVVRGAPFGLSGANDVVMQHIRVRLGAGRTFDGIGMAGSDHSIVDHSSISWTIDEAFSSRSGKNITLQRTLIAEALNVAGHKNYPEGTRHGYAASISGDIGSFHHNLLAHNEGRNWSLAGGLDGNGEFAGRLDIFNNVVYNWRSRTTDGGAHEVNFVNNYYKPGAATTEFHALNVQYENFPGTQQYYFAGNVMPGHFDEDNQPAGRTVSGSPDGYSAWVEEPFFPSFATIHSAGQAYKNVLSDVGATQPVQDDQDLRVIDETLQGTFTYRGSYTDLPGLPDHQDDVGGYEDYPEVYRPDSYDSDDDGLPDWWEKLYGLDALSAGQAFDDANNDDDGDGYTQLDRYLQWKSMPHYQLAHDETLNLSLPDVFRGYTDGPEYSVSNTINGSVNLDGDTAQFTPDECGLGSFDLTVSDNVGDSMTRKIAVFVDSDPTGFCDRAPAEGHFPTSNLPPEEPSSSSSSSSSSDSGSDDDNNTGGGGSGGGGSVPLGLLSLLLGLSWLRRQERSRV